MPTFRRALLAAASAAVIALTLSACQPPGPHVLVFGDSLTIEAKGSGDPGSILKGYWVDWSGTKYMTSPCNGIAAAKKIRWTPDVVVINYAGNRGSFQDNCMAGERGDALAARYRKDVQWLISHYRNGKTKIVVVGAPARKQTLTDGNLVFDALRDLATSSTNQVAFFDGGRLLTPDRLHLSRVATCLSPRETGSRCGTSKDPAKNYIRDAELEHLCPTGGTLNGTCSTYNSGAVRLTLNLRDGIKAAKVAHR